MDAYVRGSINQRLEERSKALHSGRSLEEQSLMLSFSPSVLFLQLDALGIAAIPHLTIKLNIELDF